MAIANHMKAGMTNNEKLSDVVLCIGKDSRKVGTICDEMKWWMLMTTHKKMSSRLAYIFQEYKTIKHCLPK